MYKQTFVILWIYLKYMKPIHEFLEEHCNHSASCLHTLVVLKFLTQCTAHNGESKNFEEESVYLCLAYVCSSELVRSILTDGNWTFSTTKFAMFDSRRKRMVSSTRATCTVVIHLTFRKVSKIVLNKSLRLMSVNFFNTTWSKHL